jgi:hypothetical protein
MMSTPVFQPVDPDTLSCATDDEESHTPTLPSVDYLRSPARETDLQPSLFSINVGGHQFTLITEHLITANVGLLSALASRTHTERLVFAADIVYLPRTHEYYFSRSPHVASVVVDYYLTGGCCCVCAHAHSKQANYTHR